MSEEYINALIKKADIIIEEPCGRNGLNCVFTLYLEFPDKTHTVLDFNPCIIPKFLEVFGLEKFSDIDGTYVRCKCKQKWSIGTHIKDAFVGVQPILAVDDEDLIHYKFGIYYGSYFEPVEKIKDGNE